MDLPQSNTRTELQFLNITNPVQSKSVANKKKVRMHVRNVYWQARKDHALAKSVTLLGPRQLRPSTFSHQCVCPRPRHFETRVTIKHCPKCGGDVSARIKADISRHVEVSSVEDELTVVTQPGNLGEADNFSALELVNPRTLGAGDRDPFSSLSVSTGQDSGTVEMLIRHWILELSSSFCTLEVAAKNATNPLAEVLVPRALADEAMFHSLLAFSSSLVDAHSGYKTGSTTTLLHRLHAMRLINETLNDPHRATSDTVLASICFVSATDNIFKDRKGHMSHQEGIFQILALRGGIDSVRVTMPMIYWRIIWADQLRGLYTNTPPRYRVYPSLLKFPSMTENASRSPDASEPWSVRGVLSPGFVALVKEIEELLQLKESCRGNIVTPDMVGHFDQQRVWIADRLTHLIVQAHDDLTGARAYEECCCLAAFLYHHVHFEPFCFVTGVQSAMLARLKQALLITDLDKCWGDDIELLLWVLVTAATVKDITRDWFLDLLRRTQKAFHPRPGLNRMKYILRRFLWNERTSKPDFDKVYERMVQA